MTIKFLNGGDTHLTDDGRTYIAPVSGYYDVRSMHRLDPYTVPATGNYTITLPEGFMFSGTVNIEKRKGSMFDYDDAPPPPNAYTPCPTLKTKCWLCQEHMNNEHVYDYTTSKYKITMNHCNRKEIIFLTSDEIEKNNKSGVYYAFLFIY